MESSIRVYARFRPPATAGVGDRDETVAPDLKFLDAATVAFGKSSFTFDSVL